MVCILLILQYIYELIYKYVFKMKFLPKKFINSNHIFKNLWKRKRINIINSYWLQLQGKALRHVYKNYSTQTNIKVCVFQKFKEVK